MDSVSDTALTPLSFLPRSARVFPAKTAVIYGRRRLSYAELEAETARVGRALHTSGIEPGDRVAYLMPNLPEMLIGHFAVPLAGGILVAMNTRLVAEEMAYILRHSGAKILVADAALLSTAVAATKGLDTVTQLVVAEDSEAEPSGADLAADPRIVTYAEFLGRATGDPLPWSVAEEHTPISINYTSGTTGQPEGCHLHPPGRLPELARPDRALPARREQRLPVDAADVPLQRLVHRRGRSPPSAAPTCACARSAATRSGPARRARRHPPQRRPDGAHHDR